VKARGVRPEAITTIHNGINFEDFQAANGSGLRKALGLEGRTVLGFTGFLREWHRLDRIIDLIATFGAEDSPHLMVVGEGPAVETCRAQAATLDIKDRVHFCGFQPREAIADHLAAMDIALQPAVTAYASPLKIFEYMESGLATIAPDQPNIREILTDNKDGLLFDPASETDLAEKAKRLIEDEPLRKRLGIEAKQTIRRRGFTWSRNAERVAGIAEAILRDRT
ncbi:MAG: glycosyltransferase, partial [Alphaproteobacteria bacterium]|nr:glycosyltransferase [Alphaproteobacteria bacterium]